MQWWQNQQTFEALLAHRTNASSLTSSILVRDAKLKISIFLSMSVFLKDFYASRLKFNFGNIIKTKETWVRALPRWRARGKFAALSSQSGRREKPMGKYNWLLSSIHFCSNLPCTLLLLLLLLHHSWLNNCHGTFNRRHHNGCRGPFSCAKVVSRVQVISVVCNPAFSEMLAFS